MDLDSYCGNLACELAGWKMKVQDVARKFDTAGCSEKVGLVPQVNELHMILEEFDDRIERLSTECSANWEPNKIGIEGRPTHSTSTSEDVWQQVSPGDFGG